MLPRFARAQRQPCKELVAEIAYLGRYANQPVSEALALPRGLRIALVKEVVKIVKQENEPQSE